MRLGPWAAARRVRQAGTGPSHACKARLQRLPATLTLAPPRRPAALPPPCSIMLHMADGQPFPYLDLACTLLLAAGAAYGMEM